MSDESSDGTERDPITCNECGDELPFAFEDQRDSITCRGCGRGGKADEADESDLPTINGREGDIDLSSLTARTGRIVEDGSDHD